MGVDNSTRKIENLKLADVDFAELIALGEPVILKSVFTHSDLYQAGQKSVSEAMSLLLKHYNNRQVTRFLGAPEIKGRFFYNEELNGFNYKTDRPDLSEVFDEILSKSEDLEHPSHYVGSTNIEAFFPGLKEAAGLNIDCQLFDEFKPHVSIWMGNETTAAAHYDVSNNIAACIVGRRRFTLFPPDQIANLYPGPLEPTPGGQVISMVNFKAPDLEQHPGFVEAMKHAQVAELEAGDMLVYPAMWWHQVEALASFNVLVNYWWNEVPDFVDDPITSLLQGIMSLRDRPEHEKQAWRHVMDYYVFGDASKPVDHLPEYMHGPLGKLDDTTARRVRAKIIQKLNR